ncbi:MAG: glycoside hydrolase family 28 protein [Bacteroidota bacterium]|nr:glycoside hydrolase family 28 protein [Bacteroidota bacterium]
MFKHTLLALCAGIFLSANAQNTTNIPGYLYANLPFQMEQVKAPVFPANTVSIIDFGAKSDGKTDNTLAFAKAIDAIVAKGGGTVEVPAGTWVTGPIVLKSNVRINTAKDVTVLFSTDKSLYPVIKANFEGLETYRCQQPISADGAQNIAITGEGTFDGSGQAWRPVKKSKVSEAQWNALVASGGVLSENKATWWPSEGAYKGSQLATDQNVPNVKDEAGWQAIKDYLRPIMVDLVNCKNVLIEGVTIQNSPSWTVHPLMCQNVIVSNVNIQNPEWGQNTDGIDIESCKNVVLFKSTFSVGDDGICVKSGKNESGRKRGIPTENLIVDGCTVYHAHGGFVVGSEMSGGVKNVKVTNCNFKGTDAGLRFKSTRGRGGVVENITIENINMNDIVGDAVLFDLFYGGSKNKDEKVKADETTPIFKNITMKNINCNGAKRALFFNGLPEMNLENISLENGMFVANEGGKISESTNVTLTNVVLKTPSTPNLIINNSQYITLVNIMFPDANKPIINVSGMNSQYISIQRSAGITYKNINWSDHASKDSVEVRGW